MGDTDGTDATELSIAAESVDLFFEIVADARRRLVLERLRASTDGVVELQEFVDGIVRREENARDDAAYRQRVAADLHHVHLPKLADWNVIDYDHRSGTARYRSNEVVEALVDVASRDELLTS